MRTSSLAAAAFVVLASVTACGSTPIAPTENFPNDPSGVALTGRVIASEMEDAAGLSEALVTATRDGSTYSTLTNSNGEFEFTELLAGEWTISVSREGYFDKVQPVHVDSTEEGVVVAIDPKPAEPIIDEVLVARAPAVKTR